MRREFAKRTQTCTASRGGRRFGFEEESLIDHESARIWRRRIRGSRAKESGVRKIEFANQSQFVEMNQRSGSSESQSEANFREQSQSQAMFGVSGAPADAQSCGP
jgi:hypothetical protein